MMNLWLDTALTFLSANWLGILIAMVILYYLQDYLMLIVSILISPIAVVGSGIWGFNKKVHWPEDEDNRLSPGNFFFFLAGTLAFLIEIWLFSIFLEYYLLGDSIMPIYGNMGVRMSVVSGVGFGMLTLIFGHLAHTLLARPHHQREVTSGSEKTPISSERIVGWGAAFFFSIATIVLGYSGGLRAHTLAQAINASAAVTFFSISIGAVFGFMMPFGAVVGMSRGGFLWHLVRNVLLGIPLMLGMMLLILAALIFFLVEILLTLATLLVSKCYSILAGMAGIRLDDKTANHTVSGWRIGLVHLLSRAEPPERLRRFLDNIRHRLNFWDVV